jgi:hypothetical protein
MAGETLGRPLVHHSNGGHLYVGSPELLFSLGRQQLFVAQWPSTLGKVSISAARGSGIKFGEGCDAPCRPSADDSHVPEQFVARPGEDRLVRCYFPSAHRLRCEAAARLAEQQE